MTSNERIDESPVMLSALQHYLFCLRQCALIHVEGVWSENFLTAAGRQLHERVDRRGGETRRRTAVAFDFELRSLTEDVARRVHALVQAGLTPPPGLTMGCRPCFWSAICGVIWMRIRHSF